MIYMLSAVTCETMSNIDGVSVMVEPLFVYVYEISSCRLVTP